MPIVPTTICGLRFSSFIASSLLLVLESYNFKSNFHSLRHTYATNCVMNNIDIKSLSEMLGHSKVSTTLNLYVHSSLDFKKTQINKIEKPSFFAE